MKKPNYSSLIIQDAVGSNPKFKHIWIITVHLTEYSSTVIVCYSAGAV